MTSVGVLGLGAMGRRIAGRLLEAGHEVVVWNRSPARVAPLLELGAREAATPAQAAAVADVLVTMVSDPAALAEVLEGPAGVTAGARRALTVIEMSTVGPAAIRRLAAALPQGTGLLDAPVLGSIAEADAGSLTILAGGPAKLVEQSRPLLSVLGNVLHVGALGAGAAAKLVANATLFAAVASLGEALALGRALGLSDDTIFEVLALTPLGEQAGKRRPAIETGQYPKRFALTLARKDADLIGQAAGAAGIKLRLGEGSRSWLADAEHNGVGDRDYTAVLGTILGERRRKTGSLSAAAAAPDGLLLDLDGVVWLCGEPIDGAAEAVARLRDRVGMVLFLTNDPQSSRGEQAARLTAIGIPASAQDVITSAAAMARYLASQPELAGSRTLVVGSPALRHEIEQAGFPIAGLSQAPRAALVVVGGHERFNYGELAAATTAIHHGAALYATGRDPVIPSASGPQPATGAILAAIETAGGATATIIGKPEPYIFEIALEMLPDCSHVAVVGDNLASDIAGAKRAGLGAILVLTGTATRQDLAHAPLQPDLVLPSLAALGTYWRPEL